MKRAICPGSMGELVQGLLDDREVLISLTVDRYAEMAVEYSDKVEPVEKKEAQRLWKSKRALDIALEEWGLGHLQDQIVFRRTRFIPEGKGFASSTADITALLGALSRLVDREIREEDVARIALQVEPSDSIVFSDMCIFDHLEGRVLVRLPVPHGLGVIVVELPGTMETLGVDRGAMRTRWRKQKKYMDQAFDDAQRGLEEGDLSLLGKAATLSSWIAQSIFPEDLFDTLVEIAQATGGLGVNRAHRVVSGGARLVNL
ncbi:MAG: hypothetical protein NTX88_10390 [Candidatus Atribacteria bacterium]|nr:hypothetical protein [Candidatus Atribacteria bacterium]